MIGASLERRTMIKAGLSLGALAAVSRLPSIAEDRVDFSRRGQFERLNVTMVRIEVGATTPFSVLHISDTHLTDAYSDEDQWKQRLKARSTAHFGGFQEAALRESVAWAKANCDYLLHTGDVMDWHSRKNLDLVKKYLGNECFGAIGNHEYTLYHYLEKEAGVRKSEQEIRKLLAGYYPFTIEFDSRVINGVNFVSLDDALGKVTAGQVKRFRAEVAKGLPIVLLKHVPFYTDFIWTAAQKYWNSGTRYHSIVIPQRKHEALIQVNDPLTRDFIAYLKTVKELRAVLAGHEHITIQDRFSPTAMEYLVGGNYLFSAQEILFS